MSQSGRCELASGRASFPWDQANGREHSVVSAKVAGRRALYVGGEVFEPFNKLDGALEVSLCILLYRIVQASVCLLLICLALGFIAVLIRGVM